MAVKIRLRRMGTNKKPFYRLVATDSRYYTKGRFLEVLGWYDPKREDGGCELKLNRVDYWLEQGAEASETAKSLIRKARKTQAAPSADEAPAVAEEAAPAGDAAPAETAGDGDAADEPDKDDT
ncbi:30S ribosomal protein S16 [Kiritimatiella glycovorans]|uniref:Small ribosomal subunit protein bS16 n=1 Tax=Kiritimatiella glycovorans TaxID=1307763 RepID=A0A0G3EGY2_9BACT|nr:30S ribosomal protein S16 [Kiritimatiella glycovorans]AKJ63389.1 30S ribosomal protein S16 [Kiritimatiella glycovorans]